MAPRSISGGSPGGRSESESPSPPPPPPASLVRLINDVDAHFQTPLRRSTLHILDSQPRVTYWDVHEREGSHDRRDTISVDEVDGVTLIEEPRGEPPPPLTATQTEATVCEYLTDSHVREDMSSSDAVEAHPMPQEASPSDSMTSSMEVQLSLSRMGEQFRLPASPGIDFGDFVYIRHPSPTADRHLELDPFNETIAYPGSLIVEDVSDDPANDYDYLESYNSNDVLDLYHRLYVRMYYQSHHDTDSDSDSGSDDGAYRRRL